MRIVLLVLMTTVLAACSDEVLGPEAPPASFVSPPIPAYGPTPTPQQRAWQDLEVTAFIHFGVNTFTGREWGTGDEDPAVFDPTALDARQWALAARDGGVGGLILTAKHHDGFALWPSAHSAHTVAASPFRGGAGDVVRELEQATREVGLEFGVYLSPWDRHERTWGTPAYNTFYTLQLDELTNPTGPNYGRLFEVWLDAAYGEEVTPEQRATYDPGLWDGVIRRRQPGAIVAFSRDVRYSGNEEGFGPETNWNDRGGYWTPTECNMPFRDGWFWHENEDPKSLDQLVETYFETVGRDCVLLLGLAPDRRGLIEDEDVERLREWRQALDALFATDFAERAAVVASSTRPGSDGWAAGAATDGDPRSFWVADDLGAWLEVDLGRPQRVGIAEVREPIRYGQRVAEFVVEAEVDGRWVEAVRGTTVGRRRLVRFEPVTARRWRLRLTDARAVPAISQFGLYGPS